MIAGVSIFTAIVIVLQFLGSFIRFGPFSISLTLIPIVVGAAVYGPAAGAWLGFVFSLIVLFTDSAAFLVVNFWGTVITVLAKGTLAGFVAGLVYKAFSNNKTLAVFLAAISCPVTNTGIFVIGCYLWFMPTIAAWAEGAGFSSSASFLFTGMIGLNFLFELLVNVILSPVIVRVIEMGKKD